MKNKKGSSDIGSILLILLLAGAGYYFFIYDNGDNNPLKQINTGGNTDTKVINGVTYDHWGNPISGGNPFEQYRCSPYSCTQYGLVCGTFTDGCGGTLDCGTCSLGYSCSNGKCIKTDSGSGSQTCVSGEKQCVDNPLLANKFGQYIMCSGGVWSSPQNCNFGYKCDGGNCVPK